MWNPPSTPTFSFNKNGETVVGVRGIHDEMIQRHNSHSRSFITFLTLMSYSSPWWERNSWKFSTLMCEAQRGGWWTQDPALVMSILPTEGKEEPVTCGGYSYAIALP